MLLRVILLEHDLSSTQLNVSRYVYLLLHLFHFYPQNLYENELYILTFLHD